MKRIYELIKKNRNDITAIYSRPGVLRDLYVSERLEDELWKFDKKDILMFSEGFYGTYEEIAKEIRHCMDHDKEDFPDYPNVLGTVIVEGIHLLDQKDIFRLKELKEFDISVVLLCKLPRRVDLNPEGRAKFDKDFKTINGKTVEDADLKHVDTDDFDNIIEVYGPWDEVHLLHPETEFIVHKCKDKKLFIVKTVYNRETHDYETMPDKN